MADWDIGDGLTLSVSIADTTGALVDPTTVVLTVLPPDGVSATPAVVKDGVGLYHGTYAPTQSGNHWYRWSGTGTVVVAEEGIFNVRTRRVL